MDDVEKFARAKEQMEEITAFYVHVGAFAAAMVVMLIVDIVDNDDWWVFWPFLGWGAGIVGHAWAVYGRIPRVIQNWQLRKIKTLKADM
jgi:hypothetical protein